MGTKYETDVVAWANEQARLIRAGRFDLLDLEHIAEEIEDVGKSEKRELASRMAVLLAHLLKWQYQPERQCKSWSQTINDQRIELDYHLDENPSLRTNFDDEKWLKMVWAKAASQARQETNLDCFPPSCPWKMTDILMHEWLPQESLEKK
ncbi:MAG: DUF29 domain-containing protein [Burkholderiales bacterium]|nr:DUF29 domain-containing protein [Burkholderiales bacterium]